MKKRIEWMDHVRGFAILLVVAFHANTLLRFGYAAPDMLTAANAIFSPYRMPILAFISGFIAHLSFTKGPSEFVWGKVRALVWPYAVWTVVYGVTAGAQYDLTQHELYISYLWYLGYIFCYYFASWLTQSVPRLPLVLVAFAIAAATPADVDAARRFFFLWGIFMLGELAYSSHGQWQRLMNSRWTFLGIASMAVVTIYAIGGDAKVLYDPLWLAATLSGVFVVCGLAIRLEPWAVRRPLRGLAFLGRNSVVYYTSHFPIIWGTVVICSTLGVTNPWLVYVTGAVAALTIGTLLALLAKKSVLVNLLFALPKRRPKDENGRSRPAPTNSTSGRDPSGA